jgi:hypothetical protein
MAEYGYKAVLALDGEEPISLDNCSYTYVRDVNEKTGDVQSPVLNGTINLMYIDHPNDNIWEWALRYKFKNGSVKLMQTDSNQGTYISVEEVKLSEAACVLLEMNYSRHGGAHFSTKLTITSNNSVVGESEDWVEKNWKLL